MSFFKSELKLNSSLDNESEKELFKFSFFSSDFTLDKGSSKEECNNISSVSILFDLWILDFLLLVE